MLCADLINIQWTDESGRTRRAVANLEDISLSGACLQLDQAIPLNTVLRIAYPKGQMAGRSATAFTARSAILSGCSSRKGQDGPGSSLNPSTCSIPRRLLQRPARAKAGEATMAMTLN